MSGEEHKEKAEAGEAETKVEEALHYEGGGGGSGPSIHTESSGFGFQTNVLSTVRFSADGATNFSGVETFLTKNLGPNHLAHFGIGVAALANTNTGELNFGVAAEGQLNLGRVFHTGNMLDRLSLVSGGEYSLNKDHQTGFVGTKFELGGEGVNKLFNNSAMTFFASFDNHQNMDIGARFMTDLGHNSSFKLVIGATVNMAQGDIHYETGPGLDH